MNSPKDDRWYRHGWAWFLFVLPGIVVIASFVTLWIAIENPQSIVRDDYYRHGLELNRSIERATAARGRGLHAEFELLPDGGIELSIQPAGDLPQSLELVFLHPTDGSLDRSCGLTALTSGHYVGRLPSLPDGKRYLQLTEPGERASWALRGTLQGSRARLLPAAD